MSGNYKVKIKDIQNKYKFKIFCASNYDDSELKRMYEAIYMALPKEKSSGTSITLDNTAKSFMKNELNATDTSQYTTTGANTIDLSIFNYGTNNGVTTSYTNGKVKYNGQISGSGLLGTCYNVSNTYNAGTYYIKITEALPYTFVILDKDYNQLGSISSGNKETTIMPSNNFTGLRFYMRSGSEQIGQNVNITFGIMIATTDVPYEPYTNGASPNPDYPQTIHTITGNNKVKVEGKNLYDADSGTIGYVDNAGSIGPATNNYASDYIYLGQNQDFTISGNRTFNNIGVAYFDKNKTIILPRSDNYSKQTITKNTGNAYYVRFWVQVNDATMSASLVKSYELMLEKGTTASSYEAYKQNAVLLTLGDKEICLIGNYKDKIFKAIKGDETFDSFSDVEKASLDYGKWYLRKAIGKVVLDGSETGWGIWTTNTNTYRIVNENIFNSSNKPYSLYSNYFMNNYFQEYNGNSAISNIDEEGIALRDNLVGFTIRINISRVTDLDGFKTWLSTHNTIVYYVLATPTNEKFNDAIQEQLEDIYYNMLSYEGQTNVSQVNNDLPFNINSSALKDLSEL